MVVTFGYQVTMDRMNNKTNKILLMFMILCSNFSVFCKLVRVSRTVALESVRRVESRKKYDKGVARCAQHIPKTVRKKEKKFFYFLCFYSVGLVYPLVSANLPQQLTVEENRMK